MKCTKCGAELRDELSFCIKCGEVNTKKSSDASGTKKKNTSFWFVLLAICFFPITLTYFVVKNKRLKRSIKAVIIALIWVMTIALSGQSEEEKQTEVMNNSVSETTEEAKQEGKNTEKEIGEQKAEEKTISGQENSEADTTIMTEHENEDVQSATQVKVKSISLGKAKTYEQLIGNQKEITVKLKPAGLSEDSFVIKNSNTSVLSTNIKSVESKDNQTIVVLQTEALSGGKAKLFIKSKDKKIASNKLTFKVSKVKDISDISDSWLSFDEMEVGDSITYTCHLTPQKLSKKDIKVVVKKSGILRVSNIVFKSKKKKTVLKFKVTAIGAGKTKLSVQSKIGKLSSNKVTIRVKKKDTSRTVYTTPYGEKYHYSSACAGENAISTTLNRAKGYYGPCGVCVG